MANFLSMEMRWRKKIEPEGVRCFLSSRSMFGRSVEFLVMKLLVSLICIGGLCVT